MVKRVRPTNLTARPTVTVVIPCYNYGHYLPEVVSGVLGQPDVDVDVIIVDDASPDGSADVARDLAAADAHVRLIEHPVNKGHIATYNDGLARATGKYVVLLSADDLLPPGALSRSIAIMESHPRVGLVYGYARSFSGQPPETDSKVRNWRIWRGSEWLALSAKTGRCFISSPEVVMRTEALREAGGYDSRLPHSGDFEMWMQTAMNWDIGRVNGATQALYRVHDSNMHLTTYAGMITDLRERRRTFEILFDEHARDRTDVLGLRPNAMRALARESLRLALASHRDGATGVEVDEYLEFATETYPQIVSSLLWKYCEQGPRRDRSIPGARARRFSSKVRRHVMWRLSRRYGI